MAKVKSQRASARKVKDKWRAKKWYKIVSPEVFGSKVIGETPTDIPEKLIGRNLEISVKDLTDDFTKSHIKVFLRIDSVQEEIAKTVFNGLEETTDYIKKLARRKKSKIDMVSDGLTKDKIMMRVKSIMVSEKRLQHRQLEELRRVAELYFKEKIPSALMYDLVGEIIHGSVRNELFDKLKKIYPVKKIEVRKVEILPQRVAEEGEVQKSPEEQKPESEQKIETPDVKSESSDNVGVAQPGGASDS